MGAGNELFAASPNASRSARSLKSAMNLVECRYFQTAHQCPAEQHAFLEVATKAHHPKKRALLGKETESAYKSLPVMYQRVEESRNGSHNFKFVLKVLSACC